MRVYDEATKKEVTTLAGGDNPDVPGHSNRIMFSVERFVVQKYVCNVSVSDLHKI